MRSLGGRGRGLDRCMCMKVPEGGLVAGKYRTGCTVAMLSIRLARKVRRARVGWYHLMRGSANNNESAGTKHVSVQPVLAGTPRVCPPRSRIEVAAKERQLLQHDLKKVWWLWLVFPAASLHFGPYSSFVHWRQSLHSEPPV